MGPRAARKAILTGERFDAREALRLGLVHQVVEPEALEAAGEAAVAALRAGGPRAQAEAKDLIFAVSGRPADRALIEETAERIARVRAGEEAREGLGAFFEKRKPKWQAE